MPRPKSPARLWLRPAEGERSAIWCIVDGRSRISTGCAAGEAGAAEACLETYIASKRDPAKLPQRRADQTYLADVLSVYLDEVVRAGQEDAVDGDAPIDPGTRRAEARIARLAAWWGRKTVAEVDEASCKAYLGSRRAANAPTADEQPTAKIGGKPAKVRGKGGARRDLEDLRAAINHHARRNLHVGAADVHLPQRGKARTRYLTRSEVARLLWVCWRHKRDQVPPRGPRKGQRVASADWHDLRHLARFILMGIYTGSRSAPILRASVYAASDRAFIDIDAGLYFRLPEDVEEADNKKAPVCRLPPQILGHIRRWKARGSIAQFVVEWHGAPVGSIKTAWATAVELAGLDGNPTPHTLRHTCVTWLKQRGVSSFEVGQFVGMSERMVEHVYGHHDPNFQRRAASAFGSRSRYDSGSATVALPRNRT